MKREENKDFNMYLANQFEFEYGDILELLCLDTIETSWRILHRTL